MSLPPQSQAGPSSQMPTKLPSFDTTLGPILVGGLIAMALWGVTCVQTFTFFTRPSTRRDPLSLKLMIVFLWLLDTFNSALDGHILYHYLVTNYVNPAAVAKPILSFTIHVTVTTTADFIIRTMFVHRIYRLSKGNRLITAWIVVVNTIALIAGEVVTAKLSKMSFYVEYHHISNLLYLYFAAGPIGDISITLTLSWLLVRSRTGAKRTDTILNTLMLYIVNTGLIVGIDAAVGMIAFIVMPNNYIFMAFYFPLSKLYHNTYLAMLNARDNLREMVNDPTSLHMSALHGRSDGTTATQNSLPEKATHSQVMEISVNTYVERDRGHGLRTSS